MFNFYKLIQLVFYCDVVLMFVRFNQKIQHNVIYLNRI